MDYTDTEKMTGGSCQNQYINKFTTLEIQWSITVNDLHVRYVSVYR